jgi:uncharacterized protein (DUF1778 family)
MKIKMNDKSEYINVRVEPETKTALIRKAKKENRTLSNYLRILYKKVAGK